MLEQVKKLAYPDWGHKKKPGPYAHYAGGGIVDPYQPPLRSTGLATCIHLLLISMDFSLFISHLRKLVNKI